jgi:hypothetical protein
MRDEATLRRKAQIHGMLKANQAQTNEATKGATGADGDEEFDPEHSLKRAREDNHEYFHADKRLMLDSHDQNDDELLHFSVGDISRLASGSSQPHHNRHHHDDDQVDPGDHNDGFQNISSIRHSDAFHQMSQGLLIPAVSPQQQTDQDHDLQLELPEISSFDHPSHRNIFS